MNIDAKKILLSASVLLVGSAVAWFIYRKLTKPSEAAETGGPMAETQTTESAANLFSNVVDKSMQAIGVGTPRGIRNNNPLNIKWSAANNWNGQTGQDSGGFSIFASPVDGVRAAAKILNSYKKIGLVTIEQIIARWTSGDSTVIQNNYVAHLVKTLNIPSNAVLNSNNYAALLSGMTYFENGQNPYPFDLFVAGVTAAGV